MSKRFHDLEIPHQWENYWTKYPHGYTIFEALCTWTKQVNDMVDSQNTWLDYLDNFVEQFEFELQKEVQATIARWQSEGLLDVIIESALHTELDNVKDELDNFRSQVAENMKRISQEVSVLEFGADPSGETPSTQAFIDCANFCAANKKNMRIPDGDFWIDGVIPFPNYYAVLGNGYMSNIIVDLPDGESVWKETSNFRYAWGFEGLRFTVKEGANINVGGIYIESSLRGAYIRNIWSYELHRPIYLGSKVWGLVTLDALFLYLLGENQDSSVTTPAFLAKGNTIMMSNIEIVGGWNRGLHLNGVTAFKLNGFNIAGSTSSIQMLEPIYVENSNNGTINSGWIEQLVDNSTSANGREIYANGKGRAIYVKDGKGITISNINISSGSIYIDNSEVKVEQIRYIQYNAGLRYLNGSVIHTDLSGIKHQSLDLDLYTDGVVYLQGSLNCPAPINDNPTFITGQATGVTATNSSKATITDDNIDFISGDRSLRVIAEDYHGALFTMTDLIVGRTYTVVAKVKVISNVWRLRLINNQNASILNSRPLTLKRDNVEGYYTLVYHFSANATSASVKFETRVQSTESRGKFNIDSIGLYKDYNVFDPSLL